MKIVLDISGQEDEAVLFYLDSLDICPCKKCEVYFGLNDLAVPEGEEGQEEDGFMCRQCLEASGTKEFYI
jgi:hypothetical protein